MGLRFPVRAVSYRRAGRLVPPQAASLRARTVVLKRGAIMDWHSTSAREELLLALRGTVDLEWQPAGRSGPRLQRLRAGECAFLPAHVLHRVVNRSSASASYVYVTGPVPSVVGRKACC